MKKITSLFLLFVSFAVSSQEKYTFNPELAGLAVVDLLKHADTIFAPSTIMSFSYSSDYVAPYSKIHPEAALAPDYLAKKLEAIRNDSLNPFNYSELGGYYSKMGEAAESQKYYTKALERLRYFKVGKDSSNYYSYSAILKINIGQDGIPDVEKALRINPSDTIAFSFYPLMLINNGRFDDAKRVLVPLLKDDGLKYSTYMFLGMVALYEKIQEAVKADENWAELIKTKDIATLIDMRPYEGNFDKKDKYFRHQQEFSRLNSCFMKLLVTLDPLGTAVASKQDLEYLEGRITYFTGYLKEKDANKYGAYFSLGFAAWLKKDYQGAISYFEKAIKAFPAGKENFNFRPSDAYTAIATLYILQKDYDKALEANQRKLKVKLLDNADKAATLLNIGKLYYAKGDQVKALEYAQKAVEVQQTFDTVFFKSYMASRNEKVEEGEQAMFKAEELITQEDQMHNLLSYYIMLAIAMSRFDFAAQLYFDNQSKLTQECTTCKYLVSHYLVKVEE
jgi:tetratricopeptide (TPR) repeat protein